MRIGHFAPHIWAPGGIATYIARLGTAQTSRGHDVWYFSCDDEPSGAPAGKKRSVLLDDPTTLLRRAHDLGIDVLHLHKHAPVASTPDATSDLGSPLVPCVRTMHGNQGSCPSGTRFLSRTGTACNRAYSPLGCLWGHVVDGCGSRHPSSLVNSFRRYHTEVEQASRTPTMTVSRFLRDEMVRSGCDPNPLHVIPSPAPTVSTFTDVPDDDVPRMLFLGRIVPHKGLGWLLDALARVDVPLHVDVAGDGYHCDAMRRQAARLGIADRVTFHGWVNPNRAGSLIDASRAVIFPSIWHEPAGLVTLEAAAHARPVIASTVGGIPEYAHPDFALHVFAGDTASMARAMTDLATDLPRAQTMGRAGRRHAETTFAMDTYLDRVEDLYRHVLANVTPDVPDDAPAPVPSDTVA